MLGASRSLRLAVYVTAAMTALCARSAMAAGNEAACAEEAAVKLPSIPGLTVTSFALDSSESRAEEALDAAGRLPSRVYGAEKWMDRLERDGFEIFGAEARRSIQNLSRSGQYAEADKAVGDAVRREAARSGSQAGIVTLAYAGGAIKGRRAFACVLLSGRYLIVPLGRVVQ